MVHFARTEYKCSRFLLCVMLELKGSNSMLWIIYYLTYRNFLVCILLELKNRNVCIAHYALTYISQLYIMHFARTISNFQQCFCYSLCTNLASQIQLWIMVELMCGDFLLCSMIHVATFYQTARSVWQLILLMHHDPCGIDFLSHTMISVWQLTLYVVVVF